MYTVYTITQTLNVKYVTLSTGFIEFHNEGVTKCYHLSKRKIPRNSHCEASLILALDNEIYTYTEYH